MGAHSTSSSYCWWKLTPKDQNSQKDPNYFLIWPFRIENQLLEQIMISTLFSSHTYKFRFFFKHGNSKNHCKKQLIFEMCRLYLVPVSVYGWDRYLQWKPSIRRNQGKTEPPGTTKFSEYSFLHRFLPHLAWQCLECLELLNYPWSSS